MPSKIITQQTKIFSAYYSKRVIEFAYFSLFIIQTYYLKLFKLRYFINSKNHYQRVSDILKEQTEIKTRVAINYNLK